MKTMFLSNYLEIEGRSDAVTFKWGGYHPSPADFQCVVLDMKLDIHTDYDNPEIWYDGYPFYSLFDDVVRLLSAGGVVICLNYYTYVNRNSILYGTSSWHQDLLAKKLDTFKYEYKYQGKEETSYDWLEQGFLKVTEIDRMKARHGQNYKLLSNVEPLKGYFQYVEQYHKVIQGIEHEAKTWKGEILWRLLADPIKKTLKATRDEAEILAVATVTNQPIAAAVNYQGFPGILLLLPTYNQPAADAETYEGFIHSVSWVLADLGEYYYELNREKLGVQLEAPPWLLKHRAKPAVEADEELAKLENARINLLAERDKYDRMLALINGYGDPLESAIGELFGKEWLGFDVEKTERGYPIDLFVKNPRTGKTLAVQATGLTGPFTQSNKHFGALMNYLTEHEQKNVNSLVERLVLVVNTYRDDPLESRTTENDISEPVRRLVQRNKICLIRSCDLYNLWNIWVDFPEKLSADDIFTQLFQCEGIWHQKQAPSV